MNITFTWENRGSAIELVFRPRFYQKHRNLAKFEPWTYRTWKGPGTTTGWAMWRLATTRAATLSFACMTGAITRASSGAARTISSTARRVVRGSAPLRSALAQFEWGPSRLFR